MISEHICRYKPLPKKVLLVIPIIKEFVIEIILSSIPNSCVEALTHNVTGDGSFKELIKVKWGHKGGALIQWNCCPYEKKDPEHTEERPWDETRRWLSASQREQPQEKLNLPISWSWPSSFQNYKKYIFIVSSHWVYDIL